MFRAQEMMETYPKPISADRKLFAEAVEVLYGCAQACTACADSCLSEDRVAELTKCARTNLDCADVCDTTGRVLSRHTEYDANITRAVLQACLQVCKSCGDECERHAGMHEHCRICAEVCRQCEQECNQVLSAIA